MHPKISYVKMIKKWNLVIGTGVYINDIDDMVAREKSKIEDEISSLILRGVLISIAIVLAIIAVVSYLANRMVIYPIRLITNTIKEFENDLTVKVPVITNNEIGELATWFNTHTDRLHNIIKEVSGAVAGINSYAGDISMAVENQATISSEQSASVAEITSTMEELSASSTQIADHSGSVVDIATGTWENTKKGALAVETVMNKMNEINQDNQLSIKEIVELGRKSKEISKIMEIINTIADQTKLIAFNAALEASSAGEAGKRFGVVAVEIRRLADSVMESTGEIESKVSEIQEAINRLVIASEKGSKGIQEGRQYASQTGALLADNVEAAKSTTNAAKQISLSTQQQKTASNQVVIALREIVSGTEQASTSIKQINTVSKQLTVLSDNLRGLVENFTLSPS
ncbi:MAG: HAMP domain-containing protein [Desulfobacteraceae bacterium]|nr:MAG: HAMP domain-containing protein [Desulfobacteraceae bacterium]